MLTPIQASRLPGRCGSGISNAVQSLCVEARAGNGSGPIRVSDQVLPWSAERKDLAVGVTRFVERVIRQEVTGHDDRPVREHGQGKFTAVNIAALFAPAARSGHRRGTERKLPARYKTPPPSNWFLGTPP